MTPNIPNKPTLDHKRLFEQLDCEAAVTEMLGNLSVSGLERTRNQDRSERVRRLTKNLRKLKADREK